MADFNTLVNGLKDHKDSPRDYFTSFFTRNNHKAYQMEEGADRSEKAALRKLFYSRKDINERTDEVLGDDPFCIEAFFVYYILNDDVYVNYRFESYYENIGSYGDLSDYQKKGFLKILNYYVEFLIDIGSFRRAIKVQRMMIRLLGSKPRALVNRLSYLYCGLEDDKEFYRHYLDSEFDAYDYILLVVTLLKNDDKIKAAEVLKEMYEKIEYAKYLDHMWDLKEDVPAQAEFMRTVEDCIEEINGVPEFFSFASEVYEQIQ